MRLVVILAVLAVVGPVVAQAQEASVVGTWKVAAGADAKNSGPREVVIRGDSTASWGKETVRWRLADGRISIALGGEWETYKIKVKTKELTLSGGDLQEPITLTRVGPATPRPDSIPVPPDPDLERS